jgi:hypothetical protein
MSSLSIMQPMCRWCGNYHDGLCPRVKIIEYYESGGVKRVEFYDTVHDPQGYPLGPISK